MTRGNLSILFVVFSVVANAAQWSEAVDVWITTGDKSQLLAQKQDLLFQPGVGSGGTPISVIPETTYQTVSGFGAAMTDSSAWLIQNELSVSQREKLMRQMFSPSSGIGLNYLRVPMGASDFTASTFYTYNDNPSGGTDALQQQFSIAHDEAYIIPLLQQARQLNPDLKLMASPWSAPAWMKTSNSLQGGSLKTEWEASYALYLAKFIQAYEDADLPIDTITLQNEPLHTTNYPTMSMSATQQTNLIKNHVGPLFSAESITTKVIVYDHNWDNTSYPIQVLDDPDARQYAAGSAFHAYAGNVSAQTTVHNAHPDKDIYFTEISGGGWATNFDDNLVWYFQNILNGSIRNWAKTAMFWNIALDQNDGPHLNGCGNCRGVVTINSATGQVTFNEEFFALGQVTKAVQPNAVRVASTTYASGVNTVAYLNPDGSLALVALNPNATTTTVRVVHSGQHFNYPIPGKSVATFLWDDQGADFDNGGFDDGGFHQGGGSLDAWAIFGSNSGNVSAATEAVLSGDRSLKLYGQFNGNENVSGVSQGITISPGDQVRASASAFVRSADSIAGTSNIAQMKIEYYSQYGGVYGSASFLGETQLTIADGNTANDIWIEHELTGIVPAGAAEARLVFQFIQPNGLAGGAVHIDDVTFGIFVTGDYNGDHVVDQHDFEAWQASFGSTTDLSADGNRDGIVNAADYVVWRKSIPAAGTAAAGSTVPEADGLGLAAGALLGAMGRKSHKAPRDRTHDSDCHSASHSEVKQSVNEEIKTHIAD